MAKRKSVAATAAAAETEAADTEVDEAEDEEVVDGAETESGDTVAGDELSELKAEIAAEKEKTAAVIAERDEALEAAKAAEKLNAENADEIAAKKEELAELKKTRAEEEDVTKTVQQGGTICEEPGRYRCISPCQRKGVRFDPDAPEEKFRISVFKAGEVISNKWKKC